MDAKHRGPGDDPDDTNALSLGEGLGNAIERRTPSLGATSAALPIPSVRAQTGDGTPARPEPPEAPELPRVDLSEIERPTRDEEALRRDRLISLLGALGTTVAAGGDSPVALNLAAGLSQGASSDLRRRRQEFKAEQKALTEVLTEARKVNRQMKQREAELDYERRLSVFEQGRKDRRQRAEATQERIAREDEQQFERELEEDEQERQLERIRERGEQRRRTARVRNQRTGGAEGTASSAAPPAYEAIPVRTKDGTWKVWEMEEGEPAGQHEGLSKADAQQLARQLNRRKGAGSRRDSTATGGSAGRRAVPDTSAASPDTTGAPSADTSDAPVRGLGRTGQANVLGPFEDQVTNAPGGGGTADPSTATSAFAGGGTGFRGATLESLADRALSIAERVGADHVLRRLRRLRDRDELDEDTYRALRRRTAVWSRLRQVATREGPHAAIDALEALFEQGELSAEETRSVLDRLEARYGRTDGRQ